MGTNSHQIISHSHYCSKIIVRTTLQYAILQNTFELDPCGQHFKSGLKSSSLITVRDDALGQASIKQNKQTKTAKLT